MSELAELIEKARAEEQQATQRRRDTLAMFLDQAARGCTSGNFSDWSQLRPACREILREREILRRALMKIDSLRAVEFIQGDGGPAKRLTPEMREALLVAADEARKAITGPRWLPVAGKYRDVIVSSEGRESIAEHFRPQWVKQAKVVDRDADCGKTPGDAFVARYGVRPEDVFVSSYREFVNPHRNECGSLDYDDVRVWNGCSNGGILYYDGVKSILMETGPSLLTGELI